MELCPDGDFRKLLSKHNGKLEENFCISVFKQYMEGFKELVQLGYIHRDVKPENALVKGDTYKVADFGFAKKVDMTAHLKLKEYLGTPLYMAPQLLDNKPYSAKSDI